MDIENFIKKIISGIENALDTANKEMKGDEKLIKSDINFDLFIEPKKDKIMVNDAKTIKEAKSILNRIKFTIKYSAKVATMAEILDQIEKDRNVN